MYSGVRNQYERYYPVTTSTNKCSASIETQQAYWKLVIQILNKKLKVVANEMGGNIWDALVEHSSQPAVDLTKLTDIYFQVSLKEAATIMCVAVISSAVNGSDAIYFGMKKEIKRTCWNPHALDKNGKPVPYRGVMGNVYQSDSKKNNDGFLIIHYGINQKENIVNSICIWDIPRDAEEFYKYMEEESSIRLKKMGDKKTKGSAALTIKVPVADYDKINVILGDKCNKTPKGKDAMYASPIMTSI